MGCGGGTSNALQHHPTVAVVATVTAPASGLVYRSNGPQYTQFYILYIAKMVLVIWIMSKPS